MNKNIYILIYLLFLTGCSSAVLVNKLFVDNELGRCFKIKKKSFVYEAQCTSLKNPSSVPNVCLGVQSFGIIRKGRKLINYEQYLKEEQYWLEHIQAFKKTVFGKQRRILYELPEGSEIQVVQVAKVSIGIGERYWAIRANIKGVEVALPTRRLHIGPLWITNRGFVQKPEFADNFLNKSACSNNH